MKPKIIIITLLFIASFTNLAKAASFSSWSTDGLVNGSVYIKTNSATSITIHVDCSRYYGETNFDLKFVLGSTNPVNATINTYATFDITASDFENYSPGSTFLEYTKTITVDSRTQSLGDGRLTLYDYINSYQWEFYTPSYPMIYIHAGGPYDQFPSRYYNTIFNYLTYLPSNINGTVIPVNDTKPVLVVGQSIYSPNNNNRLTLQTDGNLVLYAKNSSGVENAVWSTETENKPCASLYFQTDGNLVIYSGTNTPLNHVANSGLWASNINANGLGTVKYAYYRLQDDGNLVFYWPNYNSYTGFVLIIAGAADSGSGRSAHIGNLNHPLWSPATQQDYGKNYTPSPL